MGSQSYGAKPPIIHHSPSHPLKMNQPPFQGYLLCEQNLPRRWLQDPRNSHPSAPIVPSIGVSKSLTAAFGFEAWLPGSSALALPALQDNDLLAPIPSGLHGRQEAVAPAPIIFTLAWEAKGSACLFQASVTGKERSDKHPTRASFIFSLLHYKPPEGRFFSGPFLFHLYVSSVQSVSECTEKSSNIWWMNEPGKEM